MKQTLKYIYERLFESLKYAETKHSITMTIASAVIAFMSSFFSNNRIINIISSATIMLALISIIYSFIALLSRNVRINEKHRDVKSINLMDHNTISKYNEYDYVKKLKSEYMLPQS